MDLNRYSMYAPFFWITALSRLGNASAAARMVSLDICSHALVKDLFRDSILEWEVAQALVSKIDQIEKSIGYISKLLFNHGSWSFYVIILLFVASLIVKIFSSENKIEFR